VRPELAIRQLLLRETNFLYIQVDWCWYLSMRGCRNPWLTSHLEGNNAEIVHSRYSTLTSTCRS
jgi:hypothetical protein